MKYKLRFAPSPTGHLHVGNARTALVNYLYAKVNKGELLLRIDDTDVERSKQEFEESIKRDLTWLGIIWDKTDRQSERLEKYNTALQLLLSKGRAYKCYETPEELSLKRKAQLMAGRPPVYDREALKLSKADHLKLEDMGRKPHWRFRLLDDEVFWKDLVRGDCSYNMNALSDPVIMREDGRPIYTLASVVDDIDHEITHIIRGEDHVTNSAAQIQLFEALGSKAPYLGHLSLLAGAEGEGLSKRMGSLSLGSLREENLESIAVSSLLSRIGTSESIVPFKTIFEIIKSFDISKFGRNTAKFDVQELYLINQKIIQSYSYKEVENRLQSYGIKIDEMTWNLVSGNINLIKDTKIWLEVIKGSIEPIIEDHFLLKVAIETIPETEFTSYTWSEWTKIISKRTGLKGRKLFLPLRKAITGLDYGPEFSNLLPLIGREKVIERLSRKN